MRRPGQEAESTEQEPRKNATPVSRTGGRALPDAALVLLGADEEVAKRHILVDRGILRQAEHALADDVALDLARASRDAEHGREQERRRFVAAALVTTVLVGAPRQAA